MGATEGARMAAALAVLFGRASKLGAKVGTAVKAASVAARLFVAPRLTRPLSRRVPW